MLRTALRNVLAHKARLLMTVLAVLLGVAFVSGTLVFTDTLGNAFANQSAKDHHGVAVSVTTRDSGPGLTAHDLDRLRPASPPSPVGSRGSRGSPTGTANSSAPTGPTTGATSRPPPMARTPRTPS